MLRRRRQRTEDRATAQTWAPGWDVPERFNFTRDVIEVHGRSPSARALSYVDPEGIVDRRTFVEVAHDAARWAHALRARIPHPGEPVMIAAGTVPDAYLATLGALKGGLVVVPCPPDVRSGDLAFRARHSRARLVVADRSLEPEIDAMNDALESPPDVLYLDEAAAELRRYARQAPTEDTLATDRALLLYTAGTGLEPRAVVHTQAALWASRFAAEQWLAADAADLVWTSAGAGTPGWVWHGLFGPWAVGAELVVHDGAFVAEERLNLVQRLAATVVCQSPTEYRALVAAGAAIRGALPRVRQAVSTGEPLEAELVELYWEEAGIHLRDGLIQAECGLVAGTLPGDPVRPGVLGVGAPGLDVAVIDDAGTVTPPGEHGELAVHGRPPTLFAGYLAAPDSTAEALRDGWYRTGDVCVREPDGALRYVERADDVIVSAGRRISPAEVEAVVATHPAVAEVAVVASPDRERGSVVKAFVTARGGTDGTTLSTSVAAHVAAVASPQLVPSLVEVVDALPRTATGKLRRAELRRLEEERHAVAVARLEEAERAEAEAASLRHAEQLAAQEERHRAEREAERARAEAEHRRNLEEADVLRAREARETEERERAARREAARREEAARRTATAQRASADEAAAGNGARGEQREREAAGSAAEAREAAERAEREARDEARRAEEQRAQAEKAEREAAAAAQRTAREAEEQRRQAEKAEREAAARAEREARDAARRAEEERKQAERTEREAAARAQREARDAARRAEEERKQAERAQREAAARAEREAREAARRAEEARREAEKAQREAARRAEEERKQAEKAQREAAARAEREAREAAAQAEREAREAARRAEEERKRAEKSQRERVRRSVPVDEWDDEPGPDEPIPGLADRIRIYAEGSPPPDTRPAAPARPDDADADG